MKIIVFGSTGGTGIELIKQALKQGHEVTAFVRNASKVPFSDPAVKLIEGDALDLKSIQTAIGSNQAAISVLGVRLGQAPGKIRSEGTRNIVTALTSTNVR